jgi:hypothetical protein
MKKKIHIVYLYVSTAFEGGDEWSAKFGHDLEDAFLQIDGYDTEIEPHNVAIHTLDSFKEKLDVANYVILSLNQKSLDLNFFEDHISVLIESFAASKIFKLLHSPVESTSFSRVDTLLGYRFYNLQTLEQIHFNKYWNKLVDLTYDIIYRFSDRKTLGCVYLAETIEKYDVVRDDVKRELLKRGYDVLPHSSHNDGLVSEDFEKDLKACQLSVHLVGSGDSEHITTANVADLQNEAASQYSLLNPGFKRVVWLHEETQDLIEDEFLYIEKFKRDKQALNGAEIVQVPTEKLKNIILSRLEGSESNDLGISSDSGKAVPSVYVIVEQEDLLAFSEVRSKLEYKDLKIITMDFGQEQLEVFRNHRKCLATCDSVVIFHTRNNFKWLKMKLLDLKKAPGYGRKYPFKVKGVYLMNDSMLDKVPSLVDELFKFPKEGNFDTKSVEQFYEKLSTYA